MLPLQLGQLFEPHEINSPQPRYMTESKRTGQVNNLQLIVSALFFNDPAGKNCMVS